jgi:hypothetical protein
MGSCAAPSAKGDDKFITTDYLQQCLIFHKENLTFSHDVAQSAINKLMFQMLAAFAEFDK